MQEACFKPYEHGKFDKNCSLDQRGEEMEKGPQDCIVKKVLGTFQTSSVPIVDCNGVIDILASCLHSAHTNQRIPYNGYGHCRDDSDNIYDIILRGRWKEIANTGTVVCGLTQP